jgi:hypothetical protein
LVSFGVVGAIAVFGLHTVSAVAFWIPASVRETYSVDRVAVSAALAEELVRLLTDLELDAPVDILARKGLAGPRRTCSTERFNLKHLAMERGWRISVGRTIRSRYREAIVSE